MAGVTIRSRHLHRRRHGRRRRGRSSRWAARRWRARSGTGRSRSRAAFPVRTRRSIVSTSSTWRAGRGRSGHRSRISTTIRRWPSWAVACTWSAATRAGCRTRPTRSGAWARANRRGPTSPTWPRARGALATGAASGKLVAVGGVDESGNVLSSTEIFTPGVGWSPGPNLSTPREHLAAAGAGDKVYAIAGRNPDGATRSVESFIIGSDQWNDEGALHDARSGIGAGTTSSGRVCTGGGEVPGRPDTVPSIECYDGERWRRVADMSVPRHGLAVVAEGKRVHLVAGGPQPGFSFSDAHEVLEL